MPRNGCFVNQHRRACEPRVGALALKVSISWSVFRGIAALCRRAHTIMERREACSLLHIDPREPLLDLPLGGL